MSFEQRKDVYFVAAKLFLEDGKGNLLISKDRFGDWDLPGGRLRENDFEIPIEDIVERKVREELGDEVTYSLGAPTVFMRHERDEVLPSGEREKRRIFAIGYSAQYLGGDIKLGDNHEEYKWVAAKTFNPEEYFTGGWLKGVKEYLKKVYKRTDI